MKDVPIRLYKPEWEMIIERDTSFRCSFKDVLNCVDLQIVSDTLLVLQGQIYKDNPNFFHLYSLCNYELISSFGRKGRGPDEVYQPCLVPVQSNSRYLCYRDVGKEYIYRDNIFTSQLEGYAIPISNVMSWLPIGIDKNFYIYFKDNSFIYSVCNKSEDVLSEYKLYPEFIEEYYATFLSSLLTTNEQGRIAEAMVNLPQINIIDVNTGVKNSSAVDKVYKKWRKMMSKPFDASTRQYYMAIAPSSDYIFAVYSGATLAEIYQDGRYNNEIHIFDWEGNFKYRIKIDEHLSRITFDEKQGQLYGIEKETGHIVRYNIFNN